MVVTPNPHWMRARKNKCKSFDVACMQCGHSHSHQQVPFAWVARARARPVWIRPQGGSPRMMLQMTRIFSLPPLPSFSLAIEWRTPRKSNDYSKPIATKPTDSNNHGQRTVLSDPRCQRDRWLGRYPRPNCCHRPEQWQKILRKG